jgi:hypothetical protein
LRQTFLSLALGDTYTDCHRPLIEIVHHGERLIAVLSATAGAGRGVTNPSWHSRRMISER